MSQLSPPVTASDHAQGSASARYTLVEFADFQCPYCKQGHEVVKEVQRELGAQLRFVFRHLPLRDIHPHAEPAAEWAEAAAAQGQFWRAHDTLFSHQRQLTEDDLREYSKMLGLDEEKIEAELDSGRAADAVEEYVESAEASGAESTPTFFVNGQLFEGNWQDAAELIQALRGAA